MTIPLTGRVGDHGVLFTATDYRVSPGIQLGTTTYRYSLEADTPQTAFLIITSKSTSSPFDGMPPLDSVETFRIDTQGTLRRVGEVSTNAAQDSVVTITY